ncbi:MAG: AAA family ATPase [Acidimicrobiales bacterium]
MAGFFASGVKKHSRPFVEGKGERMDYCVTVIRTIGCSVTPDACVEKLSKAKRRLLAGLVAAGENGASKDALAEAVWGDRQPNGWSEALRMAAARLRPHLPKNSLPDAVDGVYRLNLEVWEVDAWQLQDLVLHDIGSGIDTSRLLHILSPLGIYPDIESMGWMQLSERSLRAAQRALIDRILQHQPELINSQLLDYFRQHAELDPYNESLLRTVITAHARSGAQNTALEILRDARHEFVDAGLTVSSAVSDLEWKLLDHQIAPDLVERATTLPTLPQPLAAALTNELVGSRDHVDKLANDIFSSGDTIQRAIVTGSSGSGKTRTVAELAQLAIDEGYEVVYLTASPIAAPAFAPLAAALPELTTTNSVGHVWAETTAALNRRADGRHLLFIADDCQWFDSQSAALVEFLARGALSAPHSVVCVATPALGSNGVWAELDTAIRRLGPTLSLEVPALDENSMHDLLRSRHPEANELLLRHVTAEVLKASGGLPAVALTVLDSLDADAQFLPPVESYEPDGLLDAVVANLSDDARRIGAVAAVIGPEFDLVDLADTSKVAGQLVLSALDELVRRQLLIERSLTTFQFPNVLVQAAFTRSTLRAQLIEWHAAAAEVFASDLHRRAYHEANAHPLVSAETAIASLLESGERYLDSELYREAAEAFRLASDRSSNPLPAMADGLFARALDLTGASRAARRRRRRAFDRAMSADDHRVALRVAASGLPEAEIVDGDRDLIAMLEAIDPEKVDDGDRHQHAGHLARQLSLAGRLEASDIWIDRMREASSSAEQVVELAIAKRFRYSSTTPALEQVWQIESVQHAIQDCPPSLGDEITMLLALDSFGAGLKDQSEKAHRSLIERPPESLTPIRRWHALLFQATTLLMDGNFDGSSLASKAAVDYGFRFGIRNSFETFAAQQFIVEMTCDRHGVLLDSTMEFREHMNDMVLIDAAVCSCLFVEGRISEAIVEAERLARGVIESPVLDGTPVLATIADALALSSDHGLLQTVSEILERRGDSFMLVGAGLGCLGPAERYLAILEPNHRAKLRLLTSATRFADQAGMALWQAKMRLDIAAATGERHWIDEACEVTSENLVQQIASD